MASDGDREAADIPATALKSGRTRAHPQVRGRALVAPVVVLLLSVSGLALFVPWRGEPFDIVDYSEFLLILKGTNGFWDQWRTLAMYYATQGRVAEAVYGFIAANYFLFGLDTPGWQLLRAAPMLLLPPSSYLVLRRLGCSQLASLIGASFFVMGSVPAAAWLRLSGEPLGALFLLGAIRVSHGWCEEPFRPRKQVTLLVCLLGMVLSKETLIVCLPFLVGVALFWPKQPSERAGRRCPGFGSLLSVCLGVAVFLAALRLWASSVQRSDAYASLYGTSTISGTSVVTRLAQLSLPISYYTDLRSLLLMPPNFVFVVGLVVGLAAIAWRRKTSAQVTGKLAVSALLPVLGILVYLPWPRPQLFYWLPFLMGLVLATAVIIDTTATGKRTRLLVVLCWIFVFSCLTLNAFSVAELTRAQRNLNYLVAEEIAHYQPSDTLMLATANLTPHRWQNPAATLSRYVQAVGLTTAPPVLLDIECQRWASDSASGYLTVRAKVTYVAGCGDVVKGDRTLRRSFRYFDWPSLRIRQSAQTVVVVNGR